MKLIITKCLLLIIGTHNLLAQPVQQWQYIRPTNTGVGGDFLLCIEVDDCGNKWTGGHLPFFSEGCVTRFNDTTWTAWSNFEGYLPADRVYDVAFDSFGGLWVATNGVGNGVDHGGISHYDGNTWTTYTSANSPLPYDDMRGIAVDNNNVVWATFREVGSTNAGGVAKFDGTNWTIYTPTNSGLQTTYVDKIDIDAQNNVWIGTNMGLIKFDGLNWILHTSQNSGISLNDVKDVEYDETTNRIYASTGISIDIYDGITWSHINSSNAPISATGLWAVDARGDSVIITTIGGTYQTYVYDGNTWVSHPEMDHTYDARIDHDGNFWICGIGFLEKYDGSGWTTYSSKNSGLPSMFNNTVFVDSKNRAWFGSSGNGGISVFDCPNWQSYNPYNHNLWPNPISYTGHGTGIAEDIYGDIWMVYSGTMGGVVQITGGDINNPSAWQVWDNNNSGISLQFMAHAAADSSGNVWFGYDGACSVSRFSHATGTWTNYNLYQLGQTNCGASTGIYALKVDPSNNVWTCGPGGLAVYDQTTWHFYSWQNTPMQQGYVFDIAFDSQNNKWIATENGLYKYDGANWTLYNTANAPFPGNSVKTVLVDKSDRVWVAAGSTIYPYPAGLFMYDGATWTSYLTTNSGLHDKSINDMYCDTLGNIWLLGETKGAAIFNPNGIIGYDCLNKDLQSCTTTGVSENGYNHELQIAAMPNPFDHTTALSVTTTKPEKITLEISDMTGKTISSQSVLFSEAGNHQMVIDLTGSSSGIYLCSIKTTKQVQKVKLVKQ